jgi:hypothetical protein
VPSKPPFAGKFPQFAEYPETQFRIAFILPPMRTVQLQREGKGMIHSNRELSSRASAWHIGTSLGAGFLILVGVVFQLAQFGFDGIAVKNFWFLSMIAANVWNFLATRSDLPALAQLMRFWPMLLVISGLSLLALPYSVCARLRVNESRSADRD